MIAWLLGAAVFLAAASASAGEVGGTLFIDGQPAANAVVSLDGAGLPLPPVASRVVMDQKNLEFMPGVLPVARGTTVEFTNSDDVQHNVFTPSAAAGRFNLGLYNRGEVRSVTLSEAGDIVVLCNIHMEMEAHILVLDTPYFGATSSTGTFRLRDVPPGPYTLRVWQRKWLRNTRAVTVGTSEPADLDIQISR